MRQALLLIGILAMTNVVGASVWMFLHMTVRSVLPQVDTLLLLIPIGVVAVFSGLLFAKGAISAVAGVQYWPQRRRGGLTERVNGH